MGKPQVMFLTLALLLAGCREPATLTLAGGGQQRLDDFEGNWLVVNYFAEWCAPCLRELPLLNTLHETGGPAVVAVSFDPLPAAELQALSERHAMVMPVAAQLNGPWPFEAPRVLPTTFVINPKGELVARHQGELRAEDIARWQQNYWAAGAE